MGEIEDYQASYEQLIVFKSGKATGLKAGFANRPMSLLRDGEYQSEEWCILPLCSGRFFEPSDSGSLVWDADRRIGGMMIAGNGNNSRMDITYAAPMERLLGDIRRRGFEVQLPRASGEGLGM